MYARIRGIGRGFFARGCMPSDATVHSYDPPPPATQTIRSPIAKAPDRSSGSHAALPWTALYRGVEVDHHPRSAPAPLTSYPSTTLNVVHTPLKAPQADALLVGTP